MSGQFPTPSTMEEKKGRRARRVPVSLAVVLATGEAHYFVETENVSETGLCLLPKKAFPVGTQHRMVFGKPPRLLRLNAIGIVRWSESGKGMGMEFTSMSRNDRQSLREFLNSYF
jgi:PilZ domain-containing protein